MDDDPDFGFLLEASLMKLGYRVSVVARGKAALEILEREVVDLLITDIYVRDMGRPIADGGLLLINRVRRPAPESKVQAKPDLPIIAVSGATGQMGQDHLLRIAASLGADEVLTKPFHPEQMNRMIARLLARDGSEASP
ncbi:MAG: response regulator [Pseudomonadota bacterium]|nr:response regulator [Pseudomonadota bacterium]